MAHDVVIKGGKVVDGTGRAPVQADVAIDDDRIVAIGTLDEEGRHELQLGIGPGMLGVRPRKFAGNPYAGVDDTGGMVFSLAPALQYLLRFSDATEVPSAHASVGFGVFAMLPFTSATGNPATVSAVLSIGFGL